jgi:hypothetical protein
MALNDTTTKSTTVRDQYNTGILGKGSDASQQAPLGDILSVLLDVSNTAVTVSAVTVGTSVTPTLTPTATGAVTPTATGAVTPTATGAVTPTATAAVSLTATAVSAATAVSPASAAYASPDQSILATLANANRAGINLCVTDIGNIITKVNAAVVDISATDTKVNAAVVDISATNTKLNAAVVDISAVDTKLNAAVVDISAIKVDVTALATQLNAALVDIKSLRACMAATAANGTMGGCTEPGLSVTTYLTGTLTYVPSSIISIRGYGGTAGVLKLIRDPARILATGEVFWDGNKGLKFCAADLLTTYDAIYAKADFSQKASCLMAAGADIV